MLRSPKRVFRSISLFLFLSSLAVFLSDWRFFARLATYPKESPITSSQWYSPLERVDASALNELPKVSQTEGRFREQTLEQAKGYAKEKNSSALIVLHEGKVVLEYYADGFDARSLTNSMSMAKTVLAILIGIAIDEGEIGSEEDAVAKYLPEWVQDSRSQIKIKHLLQMSSGLEFNEDGGDVFSALTRMHLGSNLLPLVFGAKSKQAPGLTHEYMNVNAQILGILLERATGQRFSQYLSQKLWKPLQASEAFVWLDRPGGSAKTYCCIFASAQDWARVGQLMLDLGKTAGQRVVSEKWVKKMVTPSPYNKEYGFLTWLDSGFYYLDGKGRQRVYVLPKESLVIVRLGEHARGWDHLRLPDLFRKDLQIF
ncbi:MAG: serine hydrolase [Bdellovibrionota bacterium]